MRRRRRRSRQLCPSPSARAEAGCAVVARPARPAGADPLWPRDLRRPRGRRAARVVARQRPRRLCRRHDRAEPDAALPRRSWSRRSIRRSAACWCSPRPMPRLIADGVAQPLFTNRWASGAVAPAGLSGARKLSPRRHDPGVALRASAAGSSRSGSGWSPAPTRSTSPGGWRRDRRADATACRWRFSPMAATTTATPGRPVLRRRSPPTARR